MKQINKFFIGSVASFFIFGQAVADQSVINKSEIQAELSEQLSTAIANITTTGVEMTAKTKLDEMALKQNVEQFLVFANYNQETKTATPTIVAE